jgi:hypothetical protein
VHSAPMLSCDVDLFEITMRKHVALPLAHRW